MTKKSSTLTRRDLDLIDRLYRRKVMDIETIQGQVFKDLHKSISYRRLSRLVKNGFLIKKFINENDQAKSVFTLNKKNFSEFTNSDFEKSRFTKYRSESLLHDLSLGKVLDYLENLKMVEFVLRENELFLPDDRLSKEQLQTLRNLRSDGLTRINYLGKPIFAAVEYERSHKLSSRWVSKMNSYYHNGSIGAVLYVCKDKKVLKSMMSLEIKNCSHYSPIIYYCEEKMVFENNNQIKFIDREGSTFQIS